jgi:hypothetical protein
MIPWRLLGLGAALLAICGTVWWAAYTIKTLRITAVALRVELADTRAVATANAEAAQRVKALAERSLLAVSASLEEARASRMRLEEQRVVLKNVPVTQPEEVMSDVLTAALVCLRNPATCGSENSGGGGSGP